MQKWIPLSERMPGVGTSVFVLFFDCEERLAALRMIGGAYAFTVDGNRVIHGVTHWRDAVVGMVVAADLGS